MDNIKQRLHWKVSGRKINRKTKLNHDIEQGYFIHIHCKSLWISTYQPRRGLWPNLHICLITCIWAPKGLLSQKPIKSPFANYQQMLIEGFILDCKSKIYSYYLSCSYKNSTYLNIGSYFIEM